MKYVELWCNNDNNDNTHAGDKFDAGGGAETSFPLTVALCVTTFPLSKIHDGDYVF